MSGQSALLGHAPLTPNDALVRRGLIILNPSELNPIKGQPFGAPKPAGYVYETWTPSLQIGTAFAIFFVFAFTTARLLTRWLYSRQLGWDDAVIIPGTLGCLVYLSSIMVQTTAGCLGKHVWDCTYQEVGYFMTWAQVNDPIFYFTVFTVKLSIALQNRRMTYMSSRRWKWIHWGFIGLFIILIPVLTFIEIFKCEPVRTNFSLQALASLADPRSVKCLDRTAIALADRILHIVTDCALLCVPIIIVGQLQMPWRRKLRLIAIFAIGGMSTIASIYRNVLIVRKYNDISWQSRTIYAWDIIDISFACVVANLPALNAIVDVTINKIKTYASSDRLSINRTSKGSSAENIHHKSEYSQTRTARTNATEVYMTQEVFPSSRSLDLTLHDSMHSLRGSERGAF